jgi:hypothetical protein
MVGVVTALLVLTVKMVTLQGIASSMVGHTLLKAVQSALERKINLSPQQKQIAVAKLDGWNHWFNGWNKLDDNTPPLTLSEDLPNYLTSHDAIIPVIEKQFRSNSKFAIDFMKALWNRVAIHPEIEDIDLTDVYETRHEVNLALMLSPPEQLVDALLKATGQWKD